jgi:hypothetical protein
MVDLQRASKVWDIQGFLLRDIAENPGTDLEYMFKKRKCPKFATKRPDAKLSAAAYTYCACVKSYMRTRSQLVWFFL